MIRASVVVPAYNVAKFLPQCLDSILVQTETNLEIIVVDDGSTDETPIVADQYAATDPRVRVIHQENLGLSGARNSGLMAATGEFVCFVDSDDWVEPTMAENMIRAIEATKAEVSVAGAFVDFCDEDNRLGRTDKRVLPDLIVVRGVDVDSDLIDDNVTNLLGYAWNKMYRREWLEETGIQFELGLSLIEDWIFNAQVLSQAERVVLLPEAYVHYVQRPRETLGTARDANFLGLRCRAISYRDFLMSAWGLDTETRAAQVSAASALSLWTALQAASRASSPLHSLKSMMMVPEAELLTDQAALPSPAGWRGNWTAITMKRKWYRLALLPHMCKKVLQRWQRIR